MSMPIEIPDDVFDGDNEPIAPALLLVCVDGELVHEYPPDVNPEAPGDVEPEAFYATEDDEMRVSPEARDRVMAWTPANVGQADWAGRKWRSIVDRDAEVSRVAREKIDAIKAWEAGELSRSTRRRAFFEGALIRYGAARRVIDGLKTTTLVDVVVSSRSTKATLSPRPGPDGKPVEDVVLAWAETAAPDAVKVEKSFLKSKLPKWVAVEREGELVAVVAEGEHAGEMIPGVVVDPAGVGYSVNPAR